MSFVGITLSAQNDSITKIKYIVDIPLIDAPYSFKHNALSYSSFSPGMPASLRLAKNYTVIQKYYTKRLFINPNKDYPISGKILRYAGFGLIDLIIENFFITMPLTGTWLHEEGHRAVMTQYGISSFNDMNTFPYGQDFVAVNSIKDEELANMKENHPKDFIRLPIAGIEMQFEMIKSLQKDNFYHELKLPLGFSYLFNVINSVSYVNSADDPSAVDSLTIEIEGIEGSNIKNRDFTGYDFTAWAYDLFRSDEPYANRGTHPSGVGIRRYRRTTDLTSEELGYLEKMGKRQLINFINPGILFINSIKINNNLRFNFSGFHYLTSFGDDIGGNVFLHYKNYRLFTAFHRYQNYNHSFYGLEAQLIDYEYNFMGRLFNLSPLIHLWTQPKNQEFKTSSSQFGGKLGLSAETNLGNWARPYINISAKTKGWVAGDVFLGNNFSALMGLKIHVK